MTTIFFILRYIEAMNSLTYDFPPIKSPRSVLRNAIAILEDRKSPNSVILDTSASFVSACASHAIIYKLF